jgi:hypothetical protein
MRHWIFHIYHSGLFGFGLSIETSNSRAFLGPDSFPGLSSPGIIIIFKFISLEAALEKAAELSGLGPSRVRLLTEKSRLLSDAVHVMQGDIIYQLRLTVSCQLFTELSNAAI